MNHRDHGLHGSRDRTTEIPDRQRAQLADGVRARMRGFRALHEEVLREEAHVLLAMMEMMRRQHGREYRRAGVELHAHQAVDHGMRDELVPIDAAIDDEPRRDDPRIASALRETLRMQRNLECARDFKDVDIFARVALLQHRLDERRLALIDDIAMPASLHEGDARTTGTGGGYSLCFD